jgi:hypothetical protein
VTFVLVEIDEHGIRPIRPVLEDGKGIFERYRGERAPATEMQFDAEERATIAANLRRNSCRDRSCGAFDCVTCAGEKAAVDHAIGL